MNTDQFKKTYITECYELLAEMESLLVALDCDAADNEQLNAIFRCAHSIKGGSGAFGLTYITDFTHVLEALLDGMREGKIAPSHAAVDLLLQSVDIVTQMVNAARDDVPPPAGLGGDILAQLKSFVAPAPQTAQVKAVVEQAASQTFVIRFAPHTGLFLTGNEPLLLLRELARLGTAVITADTSHVPALKDLDPRYVIWHGISG